MAHANGRSKRLNAPKPVNLPSSKKTDELDSGSIIIKGEKERQDSEDREGGRAWAPVVALADAPPREFNPDGVPEQSASQRVDTHASAALNG